jgi:hypothetical protein
VTVLRRVRRRLLKLLRLLVALALTVTGSGFLFMPWRNA